MYEKKEKDHYSFKSMLVVEMQTVKKRSSSPSPTKQIIMRQAPELLSPNRLSGYIISNAQGQRRHKPQVCIVSSQVLDEMTLRKSTNNIFGTARTTEFN